MSWNHDHARIYNPRINIAHLAAQIASQVGKPVSDNTGLTGEYELNLFGVADSVTDDTGPTLRQALDSQLGLRLESFCAPLDFIVVDHAERVPFGN